MKKFALAVHGGAGTIRRKEMTAKLEHEYRTGLEAALNAGLGILENGGAAIDAVEAAVVILENDPHFNAGRGSVFTNNEKIEMDAAMMDGRTLEAGAVAFVRNIKNPINLARMVMEQTDHVLLAGIGANEFAKAVGAEFESDEYFHTDFRYQQLLTARAAGRTQLDHAVGDTETGRQGDQTQIDKFNDQTYPKSEIRNTKSNKSKIQNLKSKMGTVGAVACDQLGSLAAATSTGGMTNKQFGRVGDTAIIGAGTYADNKSCAVSCTGHGEYFIKAATAFDVSARIKYKKLDLERAALESIKYLTAIGGEGGLIAVDALGNVVLPFNSEGMYRGWIGADGKPIVKIYK